MQKFLNNKIGIVASIWGMLGSCAILAIAIWRMINHVSEGFSEPLEMIHYGVMIPWILFMAYSEGYKGFQKSYSPRVAARAVFLRDNSTVLRAFFAPVFCMGFFDSTKKRKIVIWCLLIGVTLLVILFRFIPQPWRGVLDLGVVVGLSWGIIATIYFYLKYLFGDASDADPEVPASAGA